MAIGLGRMFGFHYHQNFNYLIIANRLPNLAQMAHFPEQLLPRLCLYSAGGKYRHQIFNICVVWFLTGLWHGASWNFILWGVFYGALLIVEKLGLLKVLEKIPSVFSHLYLLFLTLLAGLFSIPPFRQAGADIWSDVRALGQLLSDPQLSLPL